MALPVCRHRAGSRLSNGFVDNDRVLIAPSITWKPTTSTPLTLLGQYQKDDSGSATAFLPHVGTIFPGYEGRHIPMDRFASEPGFDEYKTDTASISALLEHKFSDALTVRQNMRYWRTDNEYHSMYPDLYNINLGTGTVFLDPDNRTVARYIWMEDVVS